MSASEREIKRLITVPVEDKDLVLIRPEYMAITNGNACAAALLNWFERWTLWKREQKHQTDWLQTKDCQPGVIVRGLLGAFSEAAIKAALRLLVEMGFIKKKHGGVNKFDKRSKYVLAVDAVQDEVNAVYEASMAQQAGIDGENSADRTEENHASNEEKTHIDGAKNADRSAENAHCTLDDQESLDQESLDQVFDQDFGSAAAKEAAAAAPPSTTDREGAEEKQNHFEALTLDLTRLAPPPGSALPPPAPASAPAQTHTGISAALVAFEANIGKAGAEVRAQIAQAVTTHGESVVIEKIKLAALRGARGWAYLIPMLADADPGATTAARYDMGTQESADWVNPFEERVKARQEARAKLPPEQRTWADTYEQLELMLERPTFDTWLRDARLLRLEGSTYVIGVGNTYARDMLAQRMYLTIRRALREIAGAEVDYRVEVVAEAV